MGFDRRNVKGRWHLGTLTESADTAIVGLIPPNSVGKTVLSTLTYKCGSTAHTLSFLRSQGATTTSASAAASQADIVLTSVQPALNIAGDSLAETLAANDYLCIKHSDGTYGAYKVSSVSGYTVTLSSNLTKAVSANAPVWAFYEVARTLGTPSIQVLVPTASAVNIFPGGGATPPAMEGEIGIASSLNRNEPIMIQSNNATAQGWIIAATAIYTDV